MAIINKTGIGNGNTIQAEHVTRIIDTLTNSIGSHVTVSGSFTGALTGTATITGGTATLSSAVINGTLTNGTTPLATGASSHAEGRAATASGNYSHAEGEYSIASGPGSHAEGNTTIAVGAYAHAEGSSTYAAGQGARAAGLATSASGNWSHAEGAYTNAVQTAAHTEGYYTFAREYAHAEGYLTSASQYYSHAEGQGTQTIGFASHAEGNGTDAIGNFSHTEGYQTFTPAEAAHAEGFQTSGSGTYSHAEGYQTTALLIAAHAEGYRTVASGGYSHAEGNGSIASGSYSHAEGNGTLASNTYAHSEGRLTVASGLQSHAEGENTSATNQASHAEGANTIAAGVASHTEGYRTTASVAYAHAEGQITLASGQGSHAEGGTTIASGSYSHAEGGLTWAINEGAHTEGYNTTGSGNYSHAEGYGTLTAGQGSHAEGFQTTASGSYSHAEGYQTVATAVGSHAEGTATFASGTYSHAEGNRTLTIGDQSHAEGYLTTASAASSHAEGYLTVTLPGSNYSHAEGGETSTAGLYAHSEGRFTYASGSFSHAEGRSTLTIGQYSHAEGYLTTASANYSHAEGYGTIASGTYQHVSGEWNKHGDSTSLTIIGDGTSDGARSDIFKTKVGAVEISGSLNILSRGSTSATDAVTITNSSGINLLTVQNDGNVGIGELVPPTRLYISASAPGISASSVIIQTLVVRHPASNADYLEISNTRPTNSSTASWFGAGYRLQSKIDTTWMGYMQFNGNNDAGISFGAGQNTTSGSLVPERMRIAQTGYVGIGTTVPSSSLHIKGNGGNLTLEGTDHVYMAFHPDGYNASLPDGNRKGFIGFANTTEDWLTVAGESANKGVALKAGGYVRQYVDPNGRISFGTSDTATPSHSIELQQQFGISPNSEDYTDIVQNMYWDDTVPAGWRSRQGGPGSLIRMRGGSNSGLLSASGSIEFVVFGAPPNVPYGTSITPTQSMWIDANAYVGIGSSWNNYSIKPSVPLHIVGSQTVASQQGGNVLNVVAKIASYYDGDVRGAALLLGSMNGNAPFIASENTASLYLKTSNTSRITISGSGNVGIGIDTPAHRLDVGGTARINNIPTSANTKYPLYYETDGFLVSQASDARLKTNISTLTGSLDKVNNLRGVTFNWLNEPTSSAFVGFIAQEVEAVIPELVFTNQNNPEQYKGVYYAEMTALLVEAVKTLSAENESLKSELQTIKTHLGL